MFNDNLLFVVAIIGAALVFGFILFWIVQNLKVTTRIIDTAEFHKYLAQFQRFAREYCDMDGIPRQVCEIPKDIDALIFYREGYTSYEAAICWRDDHKRIKFTEDQIKPVQKVHPIRTAQ